MKSAYEAKSHPKALASLPPPLPSSSARPLPELVNRRIAFTTPATYSDRLAGLLVLHGSTPLHIPAIEVVPRPSAPSCPLSPLSPPSPSLPAPPFPPSPSLSPPLPPSGRIFTISALGSDAQLLLDLRLPLRLCAIPSRVRVLVPDVATPAGMAAALGDGAGRKILCAVPSVVGLDEPPVERKWVTVRAPAYETRWAGPGCAEGLVGLEGELDAVVFTSTAEVQGLLKGLESVGWSWARVRERWPGMLAAAHGPVTAAGAERLGVPVDVVSRRFSSFIGVVEALAERWSGRVSHNSRSCGSL